jgi:hypothetical protein
VRMSAYCFLSMSVARRSGERMFSFLALKGANGNFGAPPTFYGLSQEARFIMVHRRLYINKALWTKPCVVASIVHTLQLGISGSECPCLSLRARIKIVLRGCRHGTNFAEGQHPDAAYGTRRARLA